MPPLPRAICPICHRSVPLRVDGEFREHRAEGGGREHHASDRKCMGSGKTRTELAEAGFDPTGAGND